MYCLMFPNIEFVFLSLVRKLLYSFKNINDNKIIIQWLFDCLIGMNHLWNSSAEWQAERERRPVNPNRP